MARRLVIDFKSYTVGPVRRLPADTLHRVSPAELEGALVPVYARTLSLVDGWGQPIRVYVGGYDEQGRAKDYVVRSLGSDRRAETSRYSFGGGSGSKGAAPSPLSPRTGRGLG